MTEIYNLNDREFKITVIKETHQVTRMFRQFDELRNKINEEKEYFIKETETIKKKQAEILDMKDIINEIKKYLESLKHRADIMDERISDLEDRKIEILPVDEEREL